MPIHDYRCGRCGHRFQSFFRTFAEVRDPLACLHCGAGDVSRLPPRVRVVRSEESRLEDLADPSFFGDVDESDPRTVAKWAKRMGQEMGEDAGPEFDEAMEAMESGEEAAAAEGGEGATDGDDEL